MQDVDRLGDARALLGFVYVGDDRQAHLLADLGEDRQRRVEAFAARALQAGAVRLVERGLVDQAQVVIAGDLGQRVRAFQRVRPAFHQAGAGDQHQRQIVANRKPVDGHVMRSGQGGRAPL